MEPEIRSISANELETFQRTMGVPFFFDPRPETVERFGKTIDLERLRAAFDGDQMVATFGAFSLRMAVPGGILPTAGTTVVTVLPTHRRRGLMRTLMTQHLTEVYERGEPLAALWASESSIYSRFGYGSATERAWMTLDKPHARLREPIDTDGSMQMLDRDEAMKVFPSVYEHSLPNRPGMSERNQAWWEHRILADPKELRFGGTEHRRVLHVREGAPAGYVIYRTRTDVETGKTQLQLVELIGADADAEKALWQYIFGVDLVSSIVHWNQPVDDPLHWWLEQPRMMERKLMDGVWVRPVDVVAALEGRCYSSAGSLVFRMHDELCPWNEGVYQLKVGDDGTACCRATDADPVIEWRPEGLGAAYLGGHRFRELGRAGVVTGKPDALNRADAMFNWDPLPWCPELF